MRVDWRSYSEEELERQYNPRVTVPDFADCLAEFAVLSEAARTNLDHMSDIPYGRGAKERLDFFPAAADDSPLHVFFHGGYWRGQDKRDYAFVAGPLVAQGFSVAVANYDLCPEVTVEEIQLQCVRCVAFLSANAAALGCSPHRMTLSGHSAGGQIVAKLAARDWRRDVVSVSPVAAVAAISGVFDLRPLLRTTMNEDIRLSEVSAELNSLDRDPPAAGVSLFVAVGAEETTEFIGQSLQYAARHGAVAKCIPDSHHFSVLGNLFLPGGNSQVELSAFLCAAAGRGQSR